MGQAGTGLGKRKGKKEISQQKIWVKDFPREPWRRRGGAAWHRARGTGWAGDTRRVLGGELLKSRLLKSLPASFPTQTINYKAVGK